MPTTVVVYARIAPDEASIACPHCDRLTTLDPPDTETAACQHCGQTIETAAVEGTVRWQYRRSFDHIEQCEIRRDQTAWGYDISLDAAPFADRPKGGSLLRQIQAGDHVVFPSLDRIFRNPIDLIETVAQFQERRVDIHSAGDPVEFDRTTDLFRLLSRLLKGQHDDVLRQAAEQARRNGKLTNQTEPLGFEAWCSQCNHRFPSAGTHCPNCGARRNKHTRFMPCVMELNHMRELVIWKDHDSCSWDDIKERAKRWTDKRGQPYSFATLRRLLERGRQLMKERQLPPHGPIEETPIVAGHAKA